MILDDSRTSRKKMNEARSGQNLLPCQDDYQLKSFDSMVFDHEECRSHVQTQTWGRESLVAASGNSHCHHNTISPYLFASDFL
jgi:hypothetical protein